MDKYEAYKWLSELEEKGIKFSDIKACADSLMKSKLYNDLEQHKMMDAAEKVCNHYRLEYSSLNEKTRKRDISTPRKIIIWYNVVINKIKPEVATTEFGLHRTSAYSAVNTINNLLFSDKGFKKEINQIFGFIV